MRKGQQDEASMNEARPREERITQGVDGLKEKQAEGFGVIRVHRPKWMLDQGIDPMQDLMEKGYVVKERPFGHDGTIDMICSPEANRQNLETARAMAEGHSVQTSGAIQSVKVEKEQLSEEDLESTNYDG